MKPEEIHHATMHGLDTEENLRKAYDDWYREHEPLLRHIFRVGYYAGSLMRPTVTWLPSDK